MTYKQDDKKRVRNKAIGLRLSERELEALNSIAEELGLNRTQVIAKLITEYRER